MFSWSCCNRATYIVSVVAYFLNGGALVVEIEYKIKIMMRDVHVGGGEDVVDN